MVPVVADIMTAVGGNTRLALDLFHRTRIIIIIIIIIIKIMAPLAIPPAIIPSLSLLLLAILFVLLSIN